MAESEAADKFRPITFEGLVRMKLSAFRDRDRTHLRDLIEVGLVDRPWLWRRLWAELRQVEEGP